MADEEAFAGSSRGGHMRGDSVRGDRPCPRGDTGTYRIVSYRVALTPRSDGTVAIDYYQRWLVTGGHIPWIMVGTPNGNFDIEESGER